MELHFEKRQWQDFLSRLDRMIDVGIQILKALQELNRIPLVEVASIVWKTKAGGLSTMSLQMPLGDEAQGFATLKVGVGSAAPAYVSTLPNDSTGKPQTLTIVSGDPNTCSISVDSPTVPAVDSSGNPLVDASGTPILAVASFKVISAASPAQPNVPITVTLNILNSDGSVAATGSDTVTVTELVTEVVGDLILAPTPIPAPTAARKY